jgi:predicted RNA binding protein YcfA (HicA-like mRNA interferase family)
LDTDVCEETHFGSCLALYDGLGFFVPKKIRELLKDLRNAGFEQIPGAGKGSHRKFVHPGYPGAVTVSGAEGADAKSYQEKQIRKAIEQVES